jgi:hypothetical protein
MASCGSRESLTDDDRLVAYFVGNTATSAITAVGLFGLLVVVFTTAASLLLRRLHRCTAPARHTGQQ